MDYDDEEDSAFCAFEQEERCMSSAAFDMEYESLQDMRQTQKLAFKVKLRC